MNSTNLLQHLGCQPASTNCFTPLTGAQDPGRQFVRGSRWEQGSNTHTHMHALPAW